MASMISLAAEPRDMTRTPRALRRAQITPGVLYGRQTEAKSLQFDAPTLLRVIQRAGTSHLIALNVKGDDAQQKVLVHDVQRDPVTSRILHVDLYATVAGEKIRIMVPLVLRGSSPAEKLGGMVMHHMETVEVECFPEDLPEFIEVDLSRLEALHSHLSVSDLPVPANVAILSSPAAEVVSVNIVRIKAEVEEVTAPAEGEVAAAAPSATEQPNKEEKSEPTPAKR